MERMQTVPFAFLYFRSRYSTTLLGKLFEDICTRICVDLCSISAMGFDGTEKGEEEYIYAKEKLFHLSNNVCC